MSKKIKRIFKKSLNEEQKKLFKLYIKNDKYTNLEEVLEDFISTLNSLQKDIFNSFFNIKTKNLKTNTEKFYLSGDDLRSISFIDLKKKILTFLQTNRNLVIDYTDRKHNRRNIYIEDIQEDLSNAVFNDDDSMRLVDFEDGVLKQLYFHRMHNIKEWEK